MRATAAVGGLLAVLSLPAPASAHPAGIVTVHGKRLVNAHGKTVRLLGVNRSGTEYACSEGWGFTDSPHIDRPDSRAMVRAIRSWKANAVRVPLNEACWLGINGVPDQWAKHNYRRRLATYVHRLEHAGIHPILDLHIADPKHYPASRSATGLRPLPDKSHSIPFWKQLARRYGDDRSIVFGIFNEPNDTEWHCLRDGCLVKHDFYNSDVPNYRSAGTQRLVDAIRDQGARNVIMVPGLNWTGNLTKWMHYRPHDPLHRIAASFHNYEGNLGSCRLDCWNSTVAPIAKRFPVITDEFGDVDCNHDYIDRYMRWADARGISYLGWTWDATDLGSWTCTGGPSLIKDFDGTPTGFGIGLRDHLRALARN